MMTKQSAVAEPADRRSGLPSIIPMTGAVGASIAGLDLRQEQPDHVKNALIRALHEHGVLVLPCDDAFNNEDHKRFASIFGELKQSPFNKGADPFVSVLDSETVGNAKYGTDRWHTDVPVVAEPPLAASLRAITLPQSGGDTMWASMYAAYEALSSRLQRFLDGLEAVQSTEAFIRTAPAAGETNLFGKPQSAVHPVVIRDEVTGKPALFVNFTYTEKILGLSEQESASVLKMLFDHVNTPDFHCRLKWNTNTVVVWEERVTQHRAINDYVGRRILQRVVVKGGPPIAYRDTDTTTH